MTHNTTPRWYRHGDNIDVSMETFQEVTDLNVFHTGGGYHIVRKAGRKGRFAEEPSIFVDIYVYH